MQSTKPVGAQQQGAQAPPVRVGVGTAAPLPSRGQERGLQEIGSACGGDGCGAGSDGSAGGEEWLLVPTKLGMAIFRSSMPPGDGLMVYRDLSGNLLIKCIGCCLVSLHDSSVCSLASTNRAFTPEILDTALVFLFSFYLKNLFRPHRSSAMNLPQWT